MTPRRKGRAYRRSELPEEGFPSRKLREDELENNTDNIPIDDDPQKTERRMNILNGKTSQMSMNDTARQNNLVMFYRNGDPHFRGLQLAINTRNFKDLSSLLSHLNEKIPTPTGVRYVFRLPDGMEVANLRDIDLGKDYVVSSVRKLIHNVPYGNVDKNWSNRRPSAGRFRRADQTLLTHNRAQFEDPNEVVSTSSSYKSSSPGQRPFGRLHVTGGNGNRTRTITIISNTDRNSLSRILINPVTQQSFEDLLYDFTHLIHMDQPPVQTLYTASSPHRRVCSFSQLFRDFKTEETFLACGREFLPLELRGNTRQEMRPMNSTPSYMNSPDTGLTRHSKPSKHLPMERYEELDEQPVSTESEFPSSTQLPESLPEHIDPDPMRVEPVQISVRGCLKTVWPPSTTEKSDPESPRKKLQLDWVYGFNSRMRGNCLLVTKQMELVYAVDSIAVVYNLDKNMQKRYVEHDDIITSMVLHPTEKYVATGQQGVSRKHSQVHIRVWDIETTNTVCTLTPEGMQTLVTSIDFSTESNGNYLLMLDGILGHHRQSVFLWDWKQRKEVARTKTSRDYVYQAKFHVDDDSTLVTYGRMHINFWRIFWTELPGGTRILRDKKGGLFQIYVPDEILCLTFDLVGNAVTGDSHGCIQVWSRDEEDAFVPVAAGHLQHAHKDRVTALMVLGDGTLVSASMNSIRAWDTLNDYSLVKERLVSARDNPIIGIASRHPDSIDGELLLARGDSSIFEGSLQDIFRPTIQFHDTAPVMTATHPREHTFVSIGTDTCVKKWSALRHQTQWSTNIECPCSSIAYHPQGHLIAVGTQTGRFIVLRDETGGHIMSCQADPLENAIHKVEFSPDGVYIALACLDNCIYIFTVQDDGMVYRKQRETALKGHVARITGLDWSTDGAWLRSQGLDDNVLHWNVLKMTMTDPFELRNTQFSSSSCLVTYSLKGLWGADGNSTEEYVVGSRSQCNDMICIGSSKGEIHLYNYPVLYNQAKCSSQKLHVGEVMDLSFIFDDSYLFSSGNGRNGCVLQWSVNRF